MTHLEFLAPFVLFLLLPSSAMALNSDGQALLAFKKGMFSDPQGFLTDWNEADITPCRWSGVLCSTIRGESEPRVQSLSLIQKQLVGAISPDLGSLPYLKLINLRGNQLIGDIPAQIFNATELRAIFFPENKLSGNLPEEIGKLSSLESLDVSGNALGGAIPNSITNCHSLTKLVLRSNRFIGKIPVGIGSDLQRLQQLDLSSNLLDGTIPSDLGSLSMLQGTLNLSDNRLWGPVPASLGKLPIHVSLDLSYNNLTGLIPQNGTLSNQGPTAFVGNPGLCGLPLKNSCPVGPFSTGFPNLPLLHPPPTAIANSPQALLHILNKKTTLGTKEIIAIAVGDVLGIAIIGLILIYCYFKTNSSCQKMDEKEKVASTQFFCCGRIIKDGNDSNVEDVEQGELVHFDSKPRFDLEELLKAPAFVLGKGGPGIVYKAVLEGGLTLVVRRLGDGGINKHKEFDSEAQSIGHLRHPNIVTLRAYFWGAEEKLLIYDFMPNGSLATLIHGENIPSWETRLRIAKGMGKGIAYLHDNSSRRHIHGDLRPANILLDPNFEPCIADFGLSRLAGIENIQKGSKLLSPFSSSTGSTTIAGGSNRFDPGFIYRPPEALANSKPTQKWDVYAFGLIVLELLSGKSALLCEGDLATDLKKTLDQGMDLSQILDPRIPAHDLPQIGEVLNLAMACVNPSPEHRPRMKHVAETLNKIEITSEGNI